MIVPLVALALVLAATRGTLRSGICFIAGAVTYSFNPTFALCVSALGVVSLLIPTSRKWWSA